MGLSLRSPSITAFVFAVLLCHGTPLRADSIPLPTVDYAAKATVYGGGTIFSRHSNGKMRVEMQALGMAQVAISFVDLRAKKAITIISLPGMGNMAVEADYGKEEAKYGVAAGQGQRVGKATIAGESCDLWEITGKGKDGQTKSGTACLTRDFIALRVEAPIKGKLETVFEVTELKRGPQDPKLLAPPANIQVVKMPKEMRSLLHP